MQGNERVRAARAAWIVATVVGIAGCGDSGGGSGGEGDPCTSSSDCDGELLCVDDVCIAPGDAGVDAGPDGSVDAGGGDGATDGGSCPSMVVCGSPPTCCAADQECVEGECLAACASGVRCGADLSTCCEGGQVCVSEACTSPGNECTDSFDCPMGSFCEPTLGRCLPQFDPVTCTTEPSFGDFEPEVEWSVTTATERPDCLHAITAPVVIDLDGDDVPEVLANMACDADWQQGILRAFDGTDGSPLWTVTDTQLNGRTSIAAGDVDGDGSPEVFGVGAPGDDRLHAFDADGNHLWASEDTDGSPLTTPAVNGAPTLADLDMDGTAEIVLGATVVDADGTLRWSSDTGVLEGTNGGYAGGISAVADIDLDGAPEVVAGRNAYENDGSSKWTATGEDGYPAIADFDDDAQPEVVLVADGAVKYVDGMDGTLEWGPVALPGGGIGGPPTIADFDGDGEPEIGVAGAGSYSVYDPAEGDSVLWSQPTEDLSSNATGSSVFDFEGDGAAEVVYADECYMRAYRGSDGTVLLEIPSSSATIHEYPLVADVDADGNSEVLIVANNRNSAIPTQCLAADSDWDGERKGLFVYGDTRDQWVRTRRIWNQHAYHVTNVESSGRVPDTEMNSWEVEGLNNYRQNVQGEGVFNAPDLKVLGLDVVLSGCPGTATLRARVSNEGSLGVEAGVPVAFRRGTLASPGELLGVVETTEALLPGASTLVELEVDLDGEPPFSFVVTVDDDGAGAGTVTECDEDDNASELGDVDCDILR